MAKNTKQILTMHSLYENLERYQCLIAKEKFMSDEENLFIKKFLNDMKNEKKRLLTFDDGWNDSVHSSPEDAARGGFFQIAKNKVQCPFCYLITSDIVKDEDVLLKHKVLRSWCPYVLGYDVGNKPMRRCDPARDRRFEHLLISK